MSTNYNQLPRKILVDLINADNGSALTTGVVTFGNPSVITGLGGRNTAVVVSAAGGSGYSGNVTVNYKRIDIATVPGSRSLQFQAGDAVNVSDLIDEINAAYGILLQAEDYVDAALPTFDGVTPHEVQYFDLVAAANSLIWTGTLTLTLNGNDVPLSNVVTVLDLNGLTYTAP